MSNRWLLVVWLGTVFLGSIDCSREDVLKVVYEWKYIDYDFGSVAARKAAIESGEYDYKKGIPVDVDRYESTTFITVMRRNGTPSSLNIVTNKNGPSGPLLKPYPDWSWAKLGNCSGITNVFRVAIDHECGKLWVIDNGKVDMTNAICDAQILVFDLKTSKLVKRVKMPQNIANNSTTGRGLPVTPALAQENSICKNIVYIADGLGEALIVYNDTDGNFKRLTSSYFNYNPKATNFTVNGQSFTLTDGVVGTAYSERTGRVYYSPMSSYNLGVLHDIASSPYKNSNLEYKDFFCTQTSVIATGRGYVFFGLVSDTSIAMYDEYRMLQPNHTFVVAKNSNTLQFISGLKCVPQPDELWALSIRYQKIQTGTINFDEVNFRILKSGLSALINIHPCDEPPPLPSPSSLLNQPCSPLLH